MATFIQGLTDINPSLEYFTPDKEFMIDYLSVKQGQFNQAKAEFNDIYSTLKSIDLTVDENRLRRDEFIKQAENEVKKLASVDISLPQNLAAAKRIFEPLVQDQAILADMTFSTKISGIAQSANNFKNSANEEDRKRYNPTSLQYAQLKQQEFISASPEKRAQMANSTLSYASNINLMEKATALAKEMDLEVKVDELTGAYKLTTTNGALVAPALEQAFFQAFSNDPEVQDYYQQKAYVDVQSTVQSLAGVADYDSAIMMIGKEYQAELESSIEATRTELSDSKSIIDAQIKQYETKITQGKVLENSEEYQNYLLLKSQLKSINASYDQLNELEKVAGTAFDTEDEIYNKAYSTLLLEDIQGAAGVLAQRDASKTMSLDDLFKLQYNRETTLIKEGISGSNGAGGGSDRTASDIHQNIRNSSDRGADLTMTDLGSNEITTARQMFTGYKDENFDLFEQTVKDFLKIPGSALSTIPSVATNREIQLYLDDIKSTKDPAARAELMKKITTEIMSSPLLTVESGVIDDLNDYALHSDQLVAAKQDFDERVSNAMNTVVASGNYDETDDFVIQNLLFDANGNLNPIEVVQSKLDQIAENGLIDDNLYSKLALGAGTMVTTMGTLPTRVKNYEGLNSIYDSFLDAAAQVYATDPTTMSEYFDAQVVGQGAGDARRSVRNYRYDPKEAFNPKETGYKSSLQALNTIDVIQSAASLGGAFVFKGTMRDKPILGAEELPQKDLTAYGLQTSLDYLVLNEVLGMAEKSGKSSSDNRPTILMDVLDNVMVGDERYVVAQFKLDNETMISLRQKGSAFDEDNLAKLVGNDGQYEDQELKSSFTLLIPERNVNATGKLPTANNRMKLAAIKQQNRLEVKYPNLGTVTYVYDEDKDIVTITGTIKSLDENGNYGFNTYVQSADVYQFDSLDRIVKEALVAIETQNFAKLEELKATEAAKENGLRIARVVK